MAKDILLLLAPGFDDPRRSGGPFICPHCNQIEGLLRSFPDLAEKLDVRRQPFPRPREAVIALVGEDNQALPILIFADNAPADAKSHGDRRFVTETHRILDLLADRHGFPRLHG